MLRYVDKLVSDQIKTGKTGLEYTGINPMWRSSWKKFYRAILQRFELRNQPTSPGENTPVQTDRQTDIPTPEPPADPDSAKVEELLDYYSDLQAEIAQELE